MADKREKVLQVIFYKTSTGREPVRDWLKDLSKEDKRIIGEDIKTVQFGYPVGMPTTRSLNNTAGLEEVRSNLKGGRIARVIFFVENDVIVLLHGFIKKSQKTPKNELDLAVKRFKLVTQMTR